MKYLKIFEEFDEFQLDEISKQEYYSILDNNRLVYIPESKVLEFKSKLSKEYKLSYGLLGIPISRGNGKGNVEFFRVEYETEIDYHITSKTFSIKKKSQGVDEPCYIMSYHYEEFTSFAAPQSHIETLPNQERISFQKKSYYRFEESDFNQMCENPQILLDYLEKDNMIKESFEMKLGTMDILNKYGLTKDDIEELFLDFSDMGYHIKMLPESISIPTGAFRYRNEYNGLIVFVKGLGAKSHEPEISSLIRKVIRNSKFLGLDMVDTPKWVTQFMQKSDLRFKFNKL